jgi:hypothetical protein
MTCENKELARLKEELWNLRRVCGKEGWPKQLDTFRENYYYSAA